MSVASANRTTSVRGMGLDGRAGTDVGDDRSGPTYARTPPQLHGTTETPLMDAQSLPRSTARDHSVSVWAANLYALALISREARGVEERGEDRIDVAHCEPSGQCGLIDPILEGEFDRRTLAHRPLEDEFVDLHQSGSHKNKEPR